MFVAQEDRILDGYEIAEVDADGIGAKVLRINSPGRANLQLAEAAARLLVLSSNLDGGIEQAVKLIRAEVLRQREAST